MVDETLKKESKKRKRSDMTPEELAERQARKKIKLEAAENNAAVEEVEIVHEKKVKKDKKKRKEEKVKKELVEENDEVAYVVPEKKKEEEEVEEGDKQATSTKEKYLNTKGGRSFSSTQSLHLMTYEEAVALKEANEKCGLKEVVEKRHFALSYHLMGEGTQKAIDFILRQAIGKYRREVRGVIIAVKSFDVVGKPRVIDEQSVYHVATKVRMMIFRPNKGDVYECVIKHIAHDYVSGLILNAITISMKIDKQFENKLQGVTLDIGDVVTAKFESMKINRGLCTLQGEFLKVLRKGNPADFQQDFKEDHKQSAVRTPKPGNRIQFDDTDEDSE